MADREHGQHRIGQVTRWTAASGGLAAAVIGVVLAQGPATASTTTTGNAPSQASAAPDGSQSGVQNTPQLDAQSGGGQGLQPPMQAPRYSPGGRSHTRSGGS